MVNAVWRPSQQKYGVAIYSYKGNGDQTLALQVGETVHILEEYINNGSESTSWYRGMSMKNKDTLGIFPACIICTKPCEAENPGQYETLTFKEDIMIREVTYVLQEWRDKWRQLFVTNKQSFDRITASMSELLSLRGQLVDRKLTHEDALDVRQDIVCVIDWGNCQLGMDLVPRIDGEQVDSDKCSIVQLYRLHKNSALIAETDMPLRKRKTTSKSSRTEMSLEAGISSHHLLVSFKNFGCNVGDSTETLLCLYHYKDNKLVSLSEKFLVRHTKHSVPEDLEKLNNYYGLFMDLSNEDIEKDIFLVAHIYRLGGMKPENSKKSHATTFKRPWGVGVTSMNMSKLPSSIKEWEFQMKVVCCTDNENKFTTMHDQLIEKVVQHHGIASGTPTGAATSKLGLTLTVAVQILNGDLATVKKEDPMLFSKGVTQIQKLGFSEVISPGEVRNDVYVTLKSAELDRGNKKSQKNVEVKVTVLDKSLTQIPNCIVDGCGDPPKSEYVSSVYYHNNKPEWNETIRISVPIDIFPGSHIFFEVFHCSVSKKSKESRQPYSVAFVKVTDQDNIVLKNDSHKLCLYKHESSRHFDKKELFTCPSMIENCTDQQKMAALAKHNFKYNEKESITISTLLCSGKFTQNGDLLGILNWRGEQFRGKIKENLQNLNLMQGEEIVKFMHDILDALFEMLGDPGIKDYNYEIFVSLINIFTLMHHAHFVTFKPMLESYITEVFSAPLVHKPLCVCFAGMIKRAMDNENKIDTQLIQSFQDMDYIFRFIVQSRRIQLKDVYSHGSNDNAEFKNNLQQIFQNMATLLSSQSKKLETYQVHLLKSLHLTYVPLLGVQSIQDVASFLKICFEEMPHDADVPEEIVQAKLSLLNEIVHTKLFVTNESRAILLPIFIEEINTCLTCKIHLKLTVALLADMMDSIFRLKQDVSIKGDIKKIVIDMFNIVMETILHLAGESSLKNLGMLKKSQDMYRSSSSVSALFSKVKGKVGPKDKGYPALEFLKQKAYVMGPSEMADSKETTDNKERAVKPYESMGLMIACLMELLRLMEDNHYEGLLHHRWSDLTIFLINILKVFKVQVQPEIFPSDWVVMRMVSNNVVFQAMNYFSNAIKENYSTEDKFNVQIWSDYFNLAVAFIIQPSLQLDRYSEVKANKLRERYQDMRVSMCHQVESLWQSLGVFKENFIPDMVGPFLELTLVPEEDVRKATLPIIYDMMEWEQTHNGNFRQVEAVMIERLDYFLTQRQNGDARYKDLFKQMLLERMQQQPNLSENGSKFIKSVTKLLEKLLDYRQVVKGEENKDKHMHNTFNILNFYKDEINRQEMYIRYVNKLHELHVGANNHAEAGLTLQLYAKILDWSDEELPVEMRYRREREQDRKETLYTQIISCFDKGKVWEYALPMCKDLAEYYEKRLDYKKLADILKQQASFYMKILEGVPVPSDNPSEPETHYPRQDPSYYRVAYYGQSFPSSYRNKQFIFRGDECLKLATFMNHVTSEFPAATILSNNNPQNDDLKDGEQQFIQICSVKPVPADRPEFNTKDVPFELRNFYNFNEVDTFQFDRPFHRGDKEKDNECKTLCIERTKMRSAYSFPGILRWYEVVKVETETLCPIRVAIETLKQYNSELTLLINRCLMNQRLYFSQLEMRLQGIINAAVNGGIAKYHEAFFTREFESQHPDEMVYLDQLKRLLMEQIHILQRGMEVHLRMAPPNLQPLHISLDQEFKKMMRAVSEHGTPMSSTSSVSTPTTPGSGKVAFGSKSESAHLSSGSFDGDIRGVPLKDKFGGSYVSFPEDHSSTPPPIPSRPQSITYAHGLLKDKFGGSYVSFPEDHSSTPPPIPSRPQSITYAHGLLKDTFAGIRMTHGSSSSEPSLNSPSDSPRLPTKVFRRETVMEPHHQLLAKRRPSAPAVPSYYPQLTGSSSTSISFVSGSETAKEPVKQVPPDSAGLNGLKFPSASDVNIPTTKSALTIPMDNVPPIPPRKPSINPLSLPANNMPVFDKPPDELVSNDCPSPRNSSTPPRERTSSFSRDLARKAQTASDHTRDSSPSAASSPQIIQRASSFSKDLLNMRSSLSHERKRTSSLSRDVSSSTATSLPGRERTNSFSKDLMRKKSPALPDRIRTSSLSRDTTTPPSSPQSYDQAQKSFFKDATIDIKSPPPIPVRRPSDVGKISLPLSTTKTQDDERL